MNDSTQPRNQATDLMRDSLALLTPDQVCAQLAITKRTLYEMVQRGRIAHLKLNGRQLRFRQNQIDAYVEAQVVPVRRPRARRIS
jgi:excisionase family DNA binding protein